jgi:hypothetical protein
MMRNVCAVAGLLVLTAAASAAQSSQVDATRLVVSPPVTVAEIDGGKMKGDLTRMAWSADGKSIYFQTVERDTRGNVDVRHYVLVLDQKEPKGLDLEPPWAAAFWAAKSAQSAPGVPSLKITIDQQQRRVAATASPVGGDMAKGGAGGGGGGGVGASTGGSSTGDAVGAAVQSQTATVVSLKLKGEVVGEFVNAPALPGTTFGWGPSGTGLIAFVNASGHLVFMDGDGRKLEVAGSKAVLLRGWSADGSRLIYLERSGRKKYTLKTLDITIPKS